MASRNSDPGQRSRFRGLLDVARAGVKRHWLAVGLVTAASLGLLLFLPRPSILTRAEAQSESGPLSCDDLLGWGNQSARESWSINCQNGNLRFELRSGDRWQRDVYHNHDAERAELASPSVYGTDIWYGFDFMVEPGPPTSSNWLEAGQFHNTPDPGEMKPSPAVAQGFSEGDVFRIFVRYDASKPLRINPKPLHVFEDTHFVRGKYYHFVYHIVYTPTDAGLVDVWRDGQQIVNYRGPVGYVNFRSPYLKVGIYRAPAAETVVAHYANVRLGNTPIH